MDNFPKIGDPIPGTNLFYEESDIANLKNIGVVPSEELAIEQMKEPTIIGPGIDEVEEKINKFNEMIGEAQKVQGQVGGESIDVERGGERIRVNAADLNKYLDQGYQIAAGTGREEIPEEVMDGEEESEEIIAGKKAIEDMNAEFDAFQKEVDALRQNARDEDMAYIQLIKDQMSARKAQMTEINRRSQAQLETGLMRGGSARYAREVAQSIVSFEEKAGMNRLAEIDAEQNRLIAEIKRAQRQEDYEVLVDKMDALDEKRDEKVKEMNKLIDVMNEENKKKEEEAEGIRKENNILTLYKQGITDPSELFAQLNYDKDGNLVGNYSLDEITDALADLPEEEGTVAFTDQEKKRLEQAELLDATRKEQLDYLYGKAVEEGLDRTDTQKMKVRAKSGLAIEEIDKLSDEEFADWLYKKEGAEMLELSKSDQRKMVVKGIPIETTEWIWMNYLVGADPEAIRQALIDEYGEQGSTYLDDFVNVIESGISIEDLLPG